MGLTDRRRLVQTLVEHCPVPSIFLYERREDGSVVYDVIDGKQRIETILMILAEGRFKQHCGIKTPERLAFYLDFVAASLSVESQGVSPAHQHKYGRQLHVSDTGRIIR